MLSEEMVKHSLTPTEVLVCGGKHGSREVKPGFGRSESGTELIAAVEDWLELRFLLDLLSVEKYLKVQRMDNGTKSDAQSHFVETRSG
jgi:hypothetical protein